MSNLSLDDAIQFEEEKLNMYQWGSGNRKEENYHRQLAEWLKDYKKLLAFREETMSKYSNLIDSFEGEASTETSRLIDEFCIDRMRGFICDYAIEKIKERGWDEDDVGTGEMDTD